MSKKPILGCASAKSAKMFQCRENIKVLFIEEKCNIIGMFIELFQQYQ